VTESRIIPSNDNQSAEVDVTVAHTSRIYDYLLGGKDNFKVDRDVAEQAFASHPGGVEGAAAMARANRAFLGRAVRYLVEEAGICQFLDIGTGIPGTGNVHHVAQQVDPACKVVYVDNDPIVLAHAHALLRGTPEGETIYIDGDFRSPETILRHAERRLLDLSQPVGLMLVGLLHVVPDSDRPYDHVAALLDRLAPGSHLVLSHMSNDLAPGMVEVNDALGKQMKRVNPPAFRGRADVEQFFAGLELVPPGVVPISQWRPTNESSARITTVYGGVGRKP
jgi:hypothetical protein